jgi:hypothetical protein
MVAVAVRAATAWVILVVMAPSAVLRGRCCLPWSAPTGATAPLACRSPAWWNPAWRNPSISSEVSTDQVKN